MSQLREFIWLLVVVGMVLTSLVISLIFILINKCISKRAARYHTNSHQSANSEFYAKSSQYHHKDLENEFPPLPPRDQFISSESAGQSYENLNENLPDYEEVEEAPTPLSREPETPKNEEVSRDCESVSTEAYDDVVPPGSENEEDYDDVG